MRIDCLHGYFKFTETKSGQISDYVSLTGAKLVSKENYFTFDYIKEAPLYSLAAKPYLGVPAIKTFEGYPWEVFEANGLIFDFQLNIVRPILTVVNRVKIQAAGQYYVSNGLILPGSITDDGKRVKGYSAWHSRQRSVSAWHYAEVQFV